jgi:hypothetical protein
MIRSLLCAVALSCLGAFAQAQTLPAPDKLIDLRSGQGRTLLKEAEAQAAFIPLSINFVTQKTPSYCGVASIVMVLNALEIPGPAVADYESCGAFTQDNFFNAATEAILPLSTLAELGMTLDQAGAMLALHPVEVEVHHAAETTLDAFREAARDYLGREGHFVIVNFLRTAVGEDGGGHMSPLAAYDAEADRFLMLDVSRYKYPPVWIRAADLYAAMNTADADNEGRTRGYVLVKRAGPAAPAK